MNFPKDAILKWCEELESGEWEQGIDELEMKPGYYCCLGVACKLFIPLGQQNKDGAGMLIGSFPVRMFQPNAPGWLQKINDDFSIQTGKSLSELNDDGMSFADIAAKLREVYL